jgi:hypothetical protein
MAYIDAGKSGDFSAVSGGEDLTEEQLGLECLMLGLRTSKGLSRGFLEGFCSAEAIRSALNEGRLQLLDNGFIRIPEDMFFISDAIIADLF